MSDSIPSWSRIAWGAARGAVYLALIGVVVFFGLTRTEVGRGIVRQQLESGFNERYAGSLDIGTLEGSLVTRLVATDVRVRAPDGRVVIALDSVRAEPQWSALVTTELSVDRLTLVRPHLRLHRNGDGRWNLRSAFQRQVPSPDESGRLDWSFVDIEVQEGRITTSRDGPPPRLVRQRWLFDYSRAKIDDLSLDASIQWTESTKQVWISAAGFSMPDHNLRLQSASGQLVRRGDRWSARSIDVALGGSQVTGRAALRSPPSDTSQSVLELELTDSQLAAGELRRLAPRLPLRDTLAVEGTVGGSLDRLVFQGVTASRGRSTVSVHGTARGLPDSLGVDLEVSEARLAATDIDAVWPAVPHLDRLRAVGPVSASGSVQGAVHWRDRTPAAFALRGNGMVQGSAGSVRGSLAVRRDDSKLRYRADLRGEQIDAAALTGRPGLESRLNGRLQVEASGASMATLDGTGSLSLTASRLGSARVSDAVVAVRTDAGVFRTDVSLRQPGGGTLELEGHYDPSSSAPRYKLSGQASALDPGSWARLFPRGTLNGRLTAEAQGGSLRTLTGSARLEIASSTLQRGDSTIAVPPHHATINLHRPSDNASRVTVGGTIGSLSVEGPVLSAAARASGQLWGRSIWSALQRELEKPLSGSPPPAPDWSEAQRRASRTFATQSRSAPIGIDAELAVNRADLLRFWWPGAPSRADDVEAQMALTLHPDTVHMRGALSAATLRIHERRIAGVEARVEGTATTPTDVFRTLQATAQIQADSVSVRGRALADSELRGSLTRRSGTLDLTVASYGATGPLRLGGTIHLDETQTRLTVETLDIATRQGTWRITRPGTLRLYSDAVAVDSLSLQNSQAWSTVPQQIRVHGTFSDRLGDTLSVDAEEVALRPFSELAALPNPIGGQLSGTLAVTGRWAQPQVRSDFRIRRVTFDRRILGTLRLQTTLAPNSPDLLVDASLSPPLLRPSDAAAVPLALRGARTIEPSRLRLSGRVRLPGLSSAPSSRTDMLDLNVEVGRADLFFFKYIFEEQLATVTGYTAGTIHVDGTFTDPVFDAEMRVPEGRFTLPDFGLAYDVSGPVRVDKRGIHLQSVRVRGNRGSATVDGSILFNDYEYFSFDLSAELSEVKIIDVPQSDRLPFYGTIWASGTATLRGPLSDATLRSPDARTTPDSELFIPTSQSGVNTGTGFIVFADSTGSLPDFRELTRRDNILADRPAGEPTFIEGLDIDINVEAPEGSTVNLVFDPIVGDVVTARGSGRVQLQRQEGDFLVYGSFNVTEGTYQFTAGEVFVRRFNISEGTITWDGDPTNALLAIQAEYRTRASPTGLPGYSDYQGRIPVRVELDISGRVETPQVDLGLSLVRDERNALVGSQTLDAILNQPDRTTEYATSVLLTNTFLLTTESFTQGGRSPGGDGEGLSAAGNQLAFNSVSQLVASQLNRYLGVALPNVDLNFGLQGEDPSDLDVIYGIALRLLNERLVIRGEGVYTGDDTENRQAQGPQGEFVVEVRLSRQVSMEVFYRRAGDDLTRGRTYTRSTGAGLSYQTEFPSWRTLFGRVFGWLRSNPDEEDDTNEETSDPVARRPDSSSSSASEEEDSSSP